MLRLFPIRDALRHELSWTHFRLLLFGVAENEQLFASKYRLVLPTEDELRVELDRERALLG